MVGTFIREGTIPLEFPKKSVFCKMPALKEGILHVVNDVGRDLKG